MDDGVEKSCWGITAKALIGLVAIFAVLWLIGGGETTAVLAAG